jgi:hypothetical protein
MPPYVPYLTGGGNPASVITEFASEFCAARGDHLGMCEWGSGECLDLANDPQNCGGPGFSCSPGQSCQHGVCSGTPPECGLGRIGAFCDLDAGEGFICCPGGCTDSHSDVNHCGECWIACGAGQTCVAGTCRDRL